MSPYWQAKRGTGTVMAKKPWWTGRAMAGCLTEGPTWRRAYPQLS